MSRLRRRAVAGDLPAVAARLIVHYKSTIHPEAVWIEAPLPERVPLKSVSAPAEVLQFVKAYEPRVIEGGLYLHQRAIIENLERQRVVLTSTTGTGKSLCFWAWLASRLARDPNATAIVCFPTQALMWSQASRLSRFSTSVVEREQVAFAGSLPDGTGWTVWKGVGGGEDRDGAMAAHVHTPSFQNARIRVATLDKVHFSLLREGSSFVKNLCAIVLDEVHGFEGIMGANVHYLLRRVNGWLAAYGRPMPGVCLASATLADPVGFASRLCGDGDWFAVSDAMATTRTSIPVGEVPTRLASQNSSGLARIAVLLDDRAQQVSLDGVLSKDDILGDTANIIYFTASKFAARLQRLRLCDKGSAREAIVYDAQLPPHRRREVERRFNEGNPQGMTLLATSALELGVDIDGLDLCMIDDPPPGRAALLQRMGRVGRRAGKPGLVLIRAGDAPGDRILAADPIAGLAPTEGRRPPLPLQLDAIRWRHAIALGEELEGRIPQSRSEDIVRDYLDVPFSGAELVERFRELYGAMVDMSATSWVYKGFRASASQGSIPVRQWNPSSSLSAPTANGPDLARIEDSLVFRDAHPEAILLDYNGCRWRVVAYDGDWAIARWSNPESEWELGKWLRTLKAIYVEPVEERVATRGQFRDEDALFSTLPHPKGATKPVSGRLTFGVWTSSRRWEGYRLLDLATGGTHAVSLADVTSRFVQAKEKGVHFPFLHVLESRTLGWEWRVRSAPVATPEEYSAFAEILADWLAFEVESSPSDFRLAFLSGDSDWCLRLHDGQPGGNGLSEALIQDGRFERTLDALIFALGRAPQEVLARVGDVLTVSRLKEVLDAVRSAWRG